MGWGEANIGRATTTLWGAGAGILAASVAGRIPAPAGWLWPERTRDITNHWSDAFNFLDLIPGPPFLLLFLLYAAIVLAICWLLRNLLLEWLGPAAATNEFGRLPFSLKPNFLDVAYLRDGRRGMLIAAVCNLVRMGIISPLFEHLPSSYSPKALKGQSRTLSELEQAVSDAIEQKVDPKGLMRDPVINAQLELAESQSKAKLDALGFGTCTATRLVAAAMSLAAVFLVDGLVVIRLIRSSLRGYHNVGLLWLFAIGATIVILSILPWVEQSRAGMRFLKRLRSDAAGVIRRMQAMSKPGDNADVIYAIAACGITAVQGTLYYEVYERMITRGVPLLDFDFDFSGIVSSDSSCSSCSGGSCGGGGCGGGGCGGGGCGGGGCGGG